MPLLNLSCRFFHIVKPPFEVRGQRSTTIHASDRLKQLVKARIVTRGSRLEHNGFLAVAFLCQRLGFVTEKKERKEGGRRSFRGDTGFKRENNEGKAGIMSV